MGKALLGIPGFSSYSFLQAIGLSGWESWLGVPSGKGLKFIRPPGETRCARGWQGFVPRLEDCIPFVQSDDGFAMRNASLAVGGEGKVIGMTGKAR